MIPSANLDGLTSEDLRLLLNGVGDINVQTLISYTSFNDESGMYCIGRWIIGSRISIHIFISYASSYDQSGLQISILIRNNRVCTARPKKSSKNKLKQSYLD